MSATTGTADREMIIERLIDAPRELVFKVWTDPDHVVHWWGPTGFTNTIHEMEVKPGGVWRFMMHGPDGIDYPNRIDFIEVVPPARLMFLHRGDGEDTADVRFHNTVTFDEQDGKTLVTMRSLFATAAERDHVVEKYGAIEGGRQHLARLAAYLEKMR